MRRIVVGQRTDEVERFGIEGQADVGHRRLGGRRHVRVEDAPHDLVGVVDGDHRVELLDGVDAIEEG